MSKKRKASVAQDFVRQFMPDLLDASALRAYVAHCPSCGTRVTLEVDPESVLAHETYTTLDMHGLCQNHDCGRRWWYSCEIDPSGTFGVLGFSCDNADRLTMDA